MVTDNEVLEFFRKELSVPVTWKGKRKLLELDTVLQDYAELDELPYTIDDYAISFNVDISSMNIEVYYPVIHKPLLTRIFKRKDIENELLKIRKPLSVRMFSESAKSGRWLYD